jgi:hypothetical protein
MWCFSVETIILLAEYLFRVVLNRIPVDGLVLRVDREVDRAESFLCEHQVRFSVPVLHFLVGRVFDAVLALKLALVVLLELA